MQFIVKYIKFYSFSGGDFPDYPLSSSTDFRHRPSIEGREQVVIFHKFTLKSEDRFCV